MPGGLPEAGSLDGVTRAARSSSWISKEGACWPAEQEAAGAQDVGVLVACVCGDLASVEWVRVPAASSGPRHSHRYVTCGQLVLLLGC